MESGHVTFLPVSLKSPPVEIELPNGGVIRLPLGVGQVVMMKVLAFVADL
jgi:transposase